MRRNPGIKTLKISGKSGESFIIGYASEKNVFANKREAGAKPVKIRRKPGKRTLEN
ncbi:MAG TPA: hypothetical protein GXX49_12055 [Clostridiaceae bacterium]|jgi:hypothetical protein|nr:hypothetical protein [Clostridiaceae bacterium]